MLDDLSSQRCTLYTDAYVETKQIDYGLYKEARHFMDKLSVKLRGIYWILYIAKE